MFAVIVLVKNVIDELSSLRNKIVLVLELRSLIGLFMQLYFVVFYVVYFIFICQS